MTTTTILALGDSTTAGTPEFRSPIEAPPHGRGNVESQYAYWLMQTHPEWRVLNHGVDGERTDQIRARFARIHADLSAEIVVVIAGVNDIYQGRSAQSVQHELEAIFNLVLAATPPMSIVAGSILPFDAATADQNNRMHAVNEWIRDYADVCRAVLFCDTRQAVAHPHDPNRLAASSDGLHPDVDGYRSMAIALEPVICRALEARARTETRRLR